jgi:type IV fimbrial biogenesis protein FimT
MENRTVSTVRQASRPSRPIEASRTRGFSLLELIMTMSVAAILLTIAIPSFRYVTNSNRVASEVNGLLGDLQFARAEAIKEGKNITVCPSTDQVTCSKSVDWETGWIVFADSNPPGYAVPAGTTALRIQTKFSSSDTFQATNDLIWVIFNRNGYAQGVAAGTTLIELQTNPVTNAWTRCLTISFTGAVATELQGTGNCT